MNFIHINFAEIKYNCPYCGKAGRDEDDKLLNRCNRNKSGLTKVKCECGNVYGFTYNYKGDAETFKI